MREKIQLHLRSAVPDTKIAKTVVFLQLRVVFESRWQGNVDFWPSYNFTHQFVSPDAELK